MCLNRKDKIKKKCTVGFKVVKVIKGSKFENWYSNVPRTTYTLGGVYKAKNKKEGIYFFLTLKAARDYFYLAGYRGEKAAILKISVKGLRETGITAFGRPSGHCDQIKVLKVIE